MWTKLSHITLLSFSFWRNTAVIIVWKIVWKNGVSIQGLSKLDRHLKDVEEKLKYIIIIMRKIRRRRVLERQKAKKGHVREIYKNRSAYGDFSTLFQELHTDQELLLCVFYILKIRTFELSNAWDVGMR